MVILILDQLIEKCSSVIVIVSSLLISPCEQAPEDWIGVPVLS